MQAGWKAYLAELIGTFALVGFGSAVVAVHAERLKGIDSGAVVAIALTHGLILMAMVYAIGHISGCHINPAVTIGLWSVGKISLNDGIAYIVAQLFGGILAGIVHAALLGVGASSAGLTTPGPGIGDGHVLVIESILTFFLVFVIMGAAVSGKAPAGFAGLAIGMTLALAILTAGPLTGASLNPARTLGPAIVSGNWTAHWAYWIGPIVGALIAANLYKRVLSNGDSGS